MSEPSSNQRGWAGRKERGSFFLMKLTALLARKLGRRVLTPLLYVIVFYFYASDRRGRRSIRQYQQHLATWSGQPALAPSWHTVFKQYLAFAECLLDRLDVWNGKLRLEQVHLDDPADVRMRLLQSSGQGRGQILVCAHLGNLDVCRAMAELGDQVPLNVLVHTHHVGHYNRLLGEAGERRMRLIQVSELDTALMMDLAQRVERGEWLAIAGDRAPLHGGRCVEVDFLGAPAAMPQGPWLMAGMLGCPVNLIHCLKVEGRYTIHLEPYIASPAWKRGQREDAIQQWAQGYADRLAKRCLDAPTQWFNFYPYWTPAATETTHAR